MLHFGTSTASAQPPNSGNCHQTLTTNPMKPNYRLRFFLLQASAASALLAASFVHAADVTINSSTSPGGTITVNSPDTNTIAVGSTATRTLTNAITLGGGTLKGGVMDNVATVSGLSGVGTSSTFVDANGVTIILKGTGRPIPPPISPWPAGSPSPGPTSCSWAAAAAAAAQRLDLR